MSGDSTADGEQEPGIKFAVVTEGTEDAPFREGQIVVCGELPAGSVREIGGSGRKPLKWYIEYDVFDDPANAAERAAEVTYFNVHEWVQDAIDQERRACDGE